MQKLHATVAHETTSLRKYRPNVGDAVRRFDAKKDSKRNTVP